VVPLLLGWGHEILGSFGSTWSGTLTRTIWCPLMGRISLLPWCTCMGGTIPFAMAAMRMTVGNQAQRSFSYLYLANVIGAILGTLVPAFLLIEMFGFRERSA